MKKLLLISFLGATLMNAATTLDIYKDKIRLNQTQSANSGGVFTFLVPSYLNLEDFDIVTKCDIENKVLSQESDTKDAKLEKLKDEYELSAIKLSSLKSQEALLRSASLEKVTSVESIDKISQKSTDLLLANLKEQREIGKKLKEQEKDLNRYLANNPPIKTKTLTLHTQCKESRATLSISYDFTQIDTNINKKIYANIGKKEVKIDEFLNIKNLSSIDLKNVTVRSLGTSYVSLARPQEFYPIYLDVGALKKSYSPQADSMELRASKSKEQKSTSYLNDSTMSALYSLDAWVIENVNIPKNEKVELNLNTQTLASNFTIFIDGYSMNLPFVETSFTPDHNINKGRANFYIDGLNVASYNINELYAQKDEKLYFGVNNHVRVTKKELKNFTENALFSTKTKYLKWEYEIVNNSKQEWRVSLSEAVPVSRNEKITASFEASQKPVLQKENGETIFEFILKPKETKKFEFGYSVKSPK